MDKAMHSEEVPDFKNTVKDPARNWTEDYSHENGKYQNKCIECGELFYGHKRRPICKVCGNKPIDWVELAKKKPPTQHESWAWQGCWADGEMVGFARCMVKEVLPLRSELQKQKELNAELLKYEVSPRVAGLIIQVRDAIATKDYDEAYHILYQIASPGFNKTDPWGELESLIKKYNPT